MVDPIEIKLDEIDSKIDQLAYAPKYKSSYEIDEMMKSKGSGGTAAMSAGLAGGAAAGGVMALVQVIGEAVSNSKILMTVMGTISKALGLLIDVILLPFLPILTTGIIWLFQGIMLFHRLWSQIWSSKVMQTIGKGLEILAGIFAKGIMDHLTLGIGFINAATSMAWTVIEWIWNLATSNAVVNIALALALGPVGILLNWLYSVITGNETPSMKLVLSVAGTAMDFLTWLWNTITSGGANLVINVTDSASKSVSSAASAVGSVASDPLGWLGGAANSLANGGAMGPLGQAAAAVGTSIFNFNGYDDAKLRKSLETLLRQQNNRYNS
jgi:hypothetical protein